jgi:L-fucose isomerase-like protein
MGKMKNIRIGFVPAHREPFDETWAKHMRQRCLDMAANIPGLEIIAPDAGTTSGGLVRNDEDADKTIQLFQSHGIDGLIIGTMTFGDEVSALTVASAFRHLPILLFGTKDDAITKQGCRRSDSFCGTLSISSGLYRRKIPFVFGGIIFPEEETFISSLKDFISVCSITRGFIGARIGLVGPRPERFETCIFSEDAMMQKFQQRVVPTSLPDLMTMVGENGPAATAVQQEMQEQADLSKLNPATVKHIVDLELALKQFVTQKKLNGLGILCWNAMQSVYGLSPCYVMGRMTDSGIMTSCEADIYGTLTMLIQYLASLETAAPHFIDWTIKHQEKDNVFLAWHCGNAPPSLACKKPGVSIKYHSILGEMLGVDRSMGTGEFQVKPGEVTLCRLIEREGQFKMLISKGEIIPSQQNLRGAWSWVQVTDLDKLYNTLVMEGFTHHASLVHGDYTRVIRDACNLMHIETCVV